MKSLTLASPAKLNLYLKVLDRRPDGHHRLVTLFHRVSLHDTLHLKRSKNFSLSCSNPRVPLGEENLMTKAYRLLQKEFPKLGGVSVRLIKKIPMAGGLGGGSSNTAFFLLGMKRLYNLNISFKRLLRIGSKLGADVPFFLYDVPQAVGEDRGDRIKSSSLVLRPASLKYWFMLIVSREGLSTKDVYKEFSRMNRPAPSLTKVRRIVKLLGTQLKEGNFDRIPELLQNDLELAAFQLNPSLEQKISQMKKLGAQAVQMSGSGPTIFAMFPREKKAGNFARKLRIDPRTDSLLICHSQ